MVSEGNRNTSLTRIVMNARMPEYNVHCPINTETISKKGRIGDNG